MPTMLTADGVPATCFTLTSQLLPPSLANTSATAPPPSSTTSSKKKAKTRLTLSALPRFTQAPSSQGSPASSSSSCSSTSSSCSQTGYQYTAQYMQQQSYYYTQQQLQLHQKDLIHQATRGTLPAHVLFPVSPRLIPMGSPGPVTPLTLEESQGGYLIAGSASNASGVQYLQQHELDKLAAIAAAEN